MVYDGVMHKVLASGARGLTLALMWSPPKLGGHFSTNKHVEGPNTTGRIEWCTERLYGVMPDHLHTWGHVSYLRVSGIHHLNLDQIRVAKNWSFACMIYMAW
jgi:hypothetical protein